MKIIDVHTHAFPDELAERAIQTLQSEAEGVEAVLDGTVGDLLASMDRAGITAAVVASIATRSTQFQPILEWSRHIRSERIIPFPSVHPADDQAPERIHQIAEAGFRGLKLHPYYQQFKLDDPKMEEIYRAVDETGLILLCHAGFDIAFARERIADPVRSVRVIERFPNMKLVLAHLGAWEDWDQVQRHLLGRPVYLDISYCLHLMDRQRAREVLLSHPPQYLLFGSDSPWADQAEAIDLFRHLRLQPELETAILGRNAQRLLELN